MSRQSACIPTQDPETLRIMEEVKRLPAPANRLLRDKSPGDGDPIEFEIRLLFKLLAELWQPGCVVAGRFFVIETRQNMQRKIGKKRNAHVGLGGQT